MKNEAFEAFVQLLLVLYNQKVTPVTSSKFQPVTSNVNGEGDSVNFMNMGPLVLQDEGLTVMMSGYDLAELSIPALWAIAGALNMKAMIDRQDLGTYTHDILRDLLGDGIFTVDGDNWREQRKDLFMKATMDSIFQVAFGIDLDNICGSSEEGVRFSRAFDNANTLTSRRFADISWKIKKYFNIGSEAELKKDMEVVDKFVYNMIQVKIEQMHKKTDAILIKRPKTN
ncbi:hypothetical protein LXL04_022775 [Taraxacum kok-saghyz]